MPLVIIAAVVISAILIVLAWMVANQSNGPATLPSLSNTVPVPASRTGMGDLRAVDTVALSSSYSGMGDLKVLEAGVGVTSAVSMVVGMGDVLADKQPAGYSGPRPYLGMETYAHSSDGARQ